MQYDSYHLKISGDYKVGFQCGLGHVEIQDSGSAYAGEVLERIEKPDQMNNDKHRTVWGLIFYENGVTYEGECMDCIRGGYVSFALKGEISYY